MHHRARELTALMGDKYLRRRLVIGATSLVRRAKYKPDTADPRLVALLARKPVRVATVAMANKMARIAWTLMTRGEVYQAHHRNDYKQAGDCQHLPIERSASSSRALPA